MLHTVLKAEESSPRVHGVHEFAERLFGAEDEDCVAEVEICGLCTIRLVHQQQSWILGILVDVAIMRCDAVIVEPVT